MRREMPMKHLRTLVVVVIGATVKMLRRQERKPKNAQRSKACR